MDASNSCCWPLVCDRILSAESSRNMQRPGCCCLRNGRGSAGVLDSRGSVDAACAGGSAAHGRLSAQGACYIMLSLSAISVEDGYDYYEGGCYDSEQ